MDWNWVSALIFNSILLVSCAFGYSWAAWKLDLKAATGWDEPSLALIFTASNFGQNFVIHMGLIYDRWGVRTAAMVGLFCKVVGLLGMYLMVTMKSYDPIVFAFLLFLDTQCSGIVIITAQMEAQKVTRNPSLRGVAASVCTASFGFGAVLWTSAYDMMFRPNLDLQFEYGCAVASVVLIASFFLHPMFAANAQALDEKEGKTSVEKKEGSEKEKADANNKRGKKDNKTDKTNGVIEKEEKKKEEAPESSLPTLLQIAMSEEFMTCMLTTCVTWGCAVIWIANLASFATASELQTGALGRFYFNVFGVTGRIISGPLTDYFRLSLPLEFFSTMTAVMATLGATGMYLSGGQLLLPCAIISGLSFGIISTIVPLLCRRMGAHIAGTIYALSKVGSMVLSNFWIYYAGKWADEAKGDAPVCIGAECYSSMWTMVITMSIPILLFLAQNTLKANRRMKVSSEKKDS